MKNKLITYGMITLGVLLLHVGFYFFIQPVGLVIGGMMGVSLLIQPIFKTIANIPVGIIYMVLNGIALIVGGIFFGKEFLKRTAFASILTPALVTLFEYLEISNRLIIQELDPSYRLLVGAVVGSLLIGAGIGVVLRYNATTGGMDVYQKIISNKFKIPFTVAVYFTDGVIVLIGMWLNLQNGLFAILAVLVTTYAIDKIAVFGRAAYALMIITDYPEEVKKAIFEQIDRGLTRVKVVGGYSNSDKELILTTVSKDQLFDSRKIISEIDPQAFTLILKTKEVLGKGFHRDQVS